VITTATRPAAPATGPGAPSRTTPVLVLVTAGVLLIGSVLATPWVVRTVAGPASASPVRIGPMGGGMMGRARTTGAGMMSGRLWLAGDGVAVPSIAAARARATTASVSQGLHPGEVIQFSNGFYVELKDTAGASVTEVLVDPATGAVATEPGPAMMWNTGSRAATVSVDQARAIATTWLQANRPGESVGSIDTYPGYDTEDTVDTAGTADTVGTADTAGTAAAGKQIGMLSVNATTGAVWYHTWHGTFIAKEDA
jgi:hypothetical protein